MSAEYRIECDGISGCPGEERFANKRDALRAFRAGGNECPESYFARHRLVRVETLEEGQTAEELERTPPRASST